MIMYKTGLYWLGNDLRRRDNRCLIKASEKLIIYWSYFVLTKGG